MLHLTNLTMASVLLHWPRLSTYLTQVSLNSFDFFVQRALSTDFYYDG